MGKHRHSTVVSGFPILQYAYMLFYEIRRLIVKLVITCSDSTSDQTEEQTCIRQWTITSTSMMFACV